MSWASLRGIGQRDVSRLVVGISDYERDPAFGPRIDTAPITTMAATSPQPPMKQPVHIGRFDAAVTEYLPSPPRLRHLTQPKT